MLKQRKSVTDIVVLLISIAMSIYSQIMAPPKVSHVQMLPKPCTLYFQENILFADSITPSLCRSYLLDNWQVIHVQPDTLFVNRLGQRLSLRQGDLRHEELFYPNDPPKAFLWQSTDAPEHLKVLEMAMQS